MYKLCVFAGTTEGREIVEFLARQDVLVTACAATAYGGALLPAGERLTVSTKRLTAGEMETLFAAERFDLVVDATHPYAGAVTENIAGACAATGTDYVRLLRAGTAAPEDAVFVPDIPAAVRYLEGTRGNILLTTGSKELCRFACLRGFSDRVYARVLPMEDSLRACREAGLPNAHILAMQGPFSKELNAAMLRSVNAKFLVTKDSGAAGGFDEKLRAAGETGAGTVVIGRPPQREGLDFDRTVSLLCRRFHLEWRPQVAVVGIGPGSAAAVTEEVRTAIARAACVIGAQRMVALAAAGQTVYTAIAPEAIAGYIREHRSLGRFAVVMSGDTGFYSGAKKLLPLLPDCDVTVLPGVSSLAYLCARLGTSYEDVVPVSVHGREYDPVPEVRRHARVFALVGGDGGVPALCRTLTENGLGGVRVSVGERLSYPDERITAGTAEALKDGAFHSLSAVLIENPAPDAAVVFGLPDEAFLRAEAIPMTKREVRAVCLSRLALTEQSVAWDVGAGTGSVAIEMALLARRGQVYAIERKPEAVELLRENGRRFHVGNLTAVAGAAPAVCAGLPAPTHAFIGGSAGHLKEILSLLLEKNPAVRIVATAITLESVAELTECAKDGRFAEVETVCLNVARDKKAGPYHLMMGQNPVYIFTMRGKTP